jgi:hypothetical protein
MKHILDRLLSRVIKDTEDTNDTREDLQALHTELLEKFYCKQPTVEDVLRMLHQTNPHTPMGLKQFMKMKTTLELLNEINKDGSD